MKIYLKLKSVDAIFFINNDNSTCSYLLPIV